MDEQSEKPEEKKYKKISKEELEKKLKAHKKWLESEGKKPREGQRLSLTDVNLADYNLRDADFRKAILERANLEGSKLWRTNFKNAYCRKVDFRKAWFMQTDLQGAVCTEASFQGARFIGANVEKANFRKADFTGADLTGMRNLNKAKLHDCNFTGATGLKGTEFAGADITGATLPADIKEFKTLEIIEETSRNARKIFLAMLLGCAYAWLTILSTTDVGLLTNSASSPLPIIRTAMPIATFYLVAPILLAGFYLYLHFYLRDIWDGLAVLPAKFEDGRALDQRAYPWLLNCLVRRHFTILKGKYPELTKPDKVTFWWRIKWLGHRLYHVVKGTRPFLTRSKEWTSIFLAWWVLPITMAAFWWRYLPRRDWTGTTLHIILIMASIIIGGLFYRKHALVLRGVRLGPFKFRRFLSHRNTYLVGGIILIALTLSSLSDQAINTHRIMNGLGGFRLGPVAYDDWLHDRNNSQDYQLFSSVGYNIFADFREKDISTRPDNYWLIPEGDRLSSLKGASLRGANLRLADASKASLQKADLRNAKLRGTFFQTADLQSADLRGADLTLACMVSANLQDALLDTTIAIEVNFLFADLRGAQFQNADLRGANFRECNLQGVDFHRAQLAGTMFHSVDLFTAKNLTHEQLKTVKWDSITRWPPYINLDSLPPPRGGR